MISIESYLCDNRGENFVKVSPDMHYTLLNTRYINGAIELNVDGIYIFDKSMWDLVDQLWVYILNILEDLHSNGSGESYFPDQPLKFSFARIPGNRIKIESFPGQDHYTAVIDTETLLSAVKHAGLLFFRSIERLLPELADTYKVYVSRLQTLRL